VRDSGAEKILDMGVRLSLDDFGTGYSSLRYLSRTRFSSIKIDRQLRDSGLQGSTRGNRIIRAVVPLRRASACDHRRRRGNRDRHLMVQDWAAPRSRVLFRPPAPRRGSPRVANRGLRDVAAA